MLLWSTAIWFVSYPFPKQTKGPGPKSHHCRFSWSIWVCRLLLCWARPFRERKEGLTTTAIHSTQKKLNETVSRRFEWIWMPVAQLYAQWVWVCEWVCVYRLKALRARARETKSGKSSSSSSRSSNKMAKERKAPHLLRVENDEKGRKQTNGLLIGSFDECLVCFYPVICFTARSVVGGCDWTCCCRFLDIMPCAVWPFRLNEVHGKARKRRHTKKPR